MTYELWHRASGNALSEYPTRGAALAAVREVLDQDGDRGVGALALLELDERGRTTLVAEGPELVALVEARAPRRSRRGSRVQR